MPQTRNIKVLCDYADQFEVPLAGNVVLACALPENEFGPDWFANRTLTLNGQGHIETTISVDEDVVTDEDGYTHIVTENITGMAQRVYGVHISHANWPNFNLANYAPIDYDPALLRIIPKPITIPSVPTPVAKGDLFPATGAGAVGRLPVGADGSIPYADSTTATGWRWDVPPVAPDHVINVKTLGAVGDGVTNDTAAFQAAIAQATFVGLFGKVPGIYVPGGWYLTEQLVLPNRCQLFGDGPGASRLVRRNSGVVNAPFITNTPHARAVGIRNLLIECSGVGDLLMPDGVTPQYTAHGIELNNTAAVDGDPNGEWTDARHYVSDLLIQNTRGHGHVLRGRGTTYTTRVQCWQTRGHGFFTGTDSFYTDCDAGASGLDGFFLDGANSRLTGCKSWFSGAGSNPSTGVDPWAVAGSALTIAGGTGHGFHFKDGTNRTNQLANCEAQDNRRAGYYLANVSRHILSNCNADSNNNLNHASRTHAGFELIGAFACHVSGVSWARDTNGVNAKAQYAGVRIQGALNSQVKVTVGGLTLRSALRLTQGLITDDSVTRGCNIELNASSGYYRPDFASTMDVDCYLGGVQRFVLTGNATINAPADFVSGTEPDGPFVVRWNGHEGQRLTLLLQQDATGGRSVTLSGFTYQTFELNTAPNAITQMDFVCDSAGVWRQINAGTAVNDPAGIGYCVTSEPNNAATTVASLGAANSTAYVMFKTYGYNANSLNFLCGTAGGNVSVGIYSPTGSGRSRLPGARRSTSGEVASPAAGIATIALSPVVQVNKGDYAALSWDGTVLTVGRNIASATGVTAGVAAFESIHPVPATATAANGLINIPWMFTQ